MSVIALVIILAFLGAVAYFTNTSAKLTPTFKWIINLVVVVVAIILILMAFGVWNEIRSVQVPKI